MSEGHSHSHHDVEQAVRRYKLVGAALIILTGVTVGASYLHMGVALGIAVGLAIALLKGSLVAAFFMHLIHEKPIVSGILILTVFFFFVLLLMPVWWQSNTITY